MNAVARLEESIPSKPLSEGDLRDEAMRHGHEDIGLLTECAVPEFPEFQWQSTNTRMRRKSHPGHACPCAWSREKIAEPIGTLSHA